MDATLRAPSPFSHQIPHLSRSFRDAVHCIALCVARKLGRGIHLVVFVVRVPILLQPPYLILLLPLILLLLPPVLPSSFSPRRSPSPPVLHAESASTSTRAARSHGSCLQELGKSPIHSPARTRAYCHSTTHSVYLPSCHPAVAKVLRDAPAKGLVSGRRECRGPDVALESSSALVTLGVVDLGIR